MYSLIRKLAATPQRSILVLGLVLLLIGNWVLPLTDRDETRFAEASREVLQRGDYVLPWFNGKWRFDKPILIYWCQSAAYRVLGSNGFAARLPSALFTTATALLLVRWGRKIADNQTAFLAGAMLLTALHLSIIGRMATADMAMIFFVTLAVWSGWELTRPENPSRKTWWCLFYVSLALGFLAKGPVAWIPLGGMLLGRLLRKDSFRLPLLETIPGLVLTVGLVACWGIPALEQSNGQFWKIGMDEHVFHRSVAANDSHGLSGWIGFVLPLPLYFLTFNISFLPWSLRKPEGVGPVARVLLFPFNVPVKIWRWWPERNRDTLGWYLLMQALLVFAVFSLVKTKLPHYTMPAFPCLALWLALQLRSDANALAWFRGRFAVMVLLIPVLMLGVGAILRNDALTEKVWRAVQSQVRPETKVGCYGYIEPSLVWKFRSVITNTLVLDEHEENARDFLTNTPPYILVLPTKDVASLPDTNGLQIQVHGLDMVKFKNRDLTVIVR